jgi:hypothetical protein
MADTRISKIKIRSGNLADLPLLDTAELGYAKDARRLFIGNDLQTAGTGDGSATVFSISTDVINPVLLKVFIDGVEVNVSNYSITTTSLTFSSPPANGAIITYKYLSEITINRLSSDIIASSYTLSSGGTNAETGFQVNTVNYDTVVMDYTLNTSNGLRVGQLRFVTDVGASTTAIDDNYTETSPVNITFSVDISSPNTMKLLYTDNDNATAKFKFTYQLWNSQ